MSTIRVLPKPHFEEIGKMEELFDEVPFNWKINDKSPLLSNQDFVYNFSYISPTFLFANASWMLKLYPKFSKDFVTVYIYSNRTRECSVNYCLGLTNTDGSQKILRRGIMKADDEWSSACKLFSSSKIPNVSPLKIFCKLERIIPQSQRSTVLNEVKPLRLKGLEKLSDNFKDLFCYKDRCDTTVKVQDKEYRVHRCVLIARSTVFAASFKHDTQERQTGVIEISDCDPESFQDFLMYLYSGKMEELTVHKALNLYYTSDKYDIQELKAFCIEYLLQCLTAQNMCEIAVFAYEYEETKLFSMVQDFFNKNMCEVFETGEWECLLKKNYRLADKLLKEMSNVNLKK